MDALELVAFCAWCFAVALTGGLAGLVLGNIRLPVVLIAASGPAAGAGANIGISGVAALAAAATHVRAGRINWRLFAWMAPPSMAGAVGGGYLSGAIPGDALLLIIGTVLVLFGIDLLRPARAEPAAPRPPHRGKDSVGSSPPPAAPLPFPWRRGPPGSSPTGAERGPQEASPEAFDVRAAVLTGVVIGTLGGLVGLILGALRMPALLKYVGEAPARAVGTNLAVGVCVGIAGVAGHAPGGVDWSLLAIGSAASIPGALLGARLTGRLSEAQLLRAIGAVLVVAGAATAAQGIA